jgi:regulator of replication initiation timing
LEDQVHSLEIRNHDLKEELNDLEVENQRLFIGNEDLQKEMNDVVAMLSTIVDKHQTA